VLGEVCEQAAGKKTFVGRNSRYGSDVRVCFEGALRWISPLSPATGVVPWPLLARRYFLPHR
jgi:hypothetical protein